PPRHHAPRAPGALVAVERDQVAVIAEVVPGHAAQVDAGPALVEAVRTDAGALDCFPRGLEHQALLWVHRPGLARRDPEERRVEVLDLAHEPALADVALARGLGIGVVDVEPGPPRRELADRVAAVGEEL